MRRKPLKKVPTYLPHFHYKIRFYIFFVLAKKKKKLFKFAFQLSVWREKGSVSSQRDSRNKTEDLIQNTIIFVDFVDNKEIGSITK